MMPSEGKVFELFVGSSNMVALLYNFDVDSSTLKPQHTDWLAKSLKPYFSSNKHRGTIVGLASRTGRNDHNMRLSRARAHAVEAAVLRLDPSAPRIHTYVTAALGEEMARVSGQADNTEDGRWRGVMLKIGDRKPWKPIVPGRPILPLPKFKRRVWVKHFLTDNVTGVPRDPADRRADKIAEASRQLLQTLSEPTPMAEKKQEFAIDPSFRWKITIVSVTRQNNVTKSGSVKATIEWIEVSYTREPDKGQPCQLIIDGAAKGHLSAQDAIDWTDRPLTTYRRRWLNAL